MAFTLRDYQEDAVVSVRTAFLNGKKYVLVVLATGAGKTVIFSYIARNAAELGNNVLILAHRDQLIKQASAKLREYDVQHGIIMAGFTPNPRARVQVGSIQTIVRRLKALDAKRNLAADKARAAALALGKTDAEADAAAFAAKHANDPKLIVIDEAHLSAAETYRKILEFYPYARVLGVTGSPCRLDNKALGREQGGIYDEMIKGISIGQLIQRGFLMKPVVYAPTEQLDLSGVKKTAGDYNTQQLAAVVDKPTITGDAVKMYQRICPGVPAVAWCVTVEHAQHVADEFNAAGIKALMLCGEHDSAYRDKALKALETGEVQVITFVGILIEGVDCPAIGAIILLRPTMSLSSYLQVIGRGLRPFTYRNGLVKTVCYVLDHCGLTFKHGLADEEREWDLNEGEKKKKRGKREPVERVDVQQCKVCFGVFQAAAAMEAGQAGQLNLGQPGRPCCPHCHAPIEVKQRKLEVIEGELQEITPEMVAAIKRKRLAEVKKARNRDDLQRIADERGYAPGWVERQWEAKQKARERFKPRRPTVPPMPILRAMSLEQLEAVANDQGWPSDWAFRFYWDCRKVAG